MMMIINTIIIIHTQILTKVPTLNAIGIRIIYYIVVIVERNPTKYTFKKEKYTQ